MWEQIQGLLEPLFDWINDSVIDNIFKPIIEFLIDGLFGVEASFGSFLKFGTKDFDLISILYNYLAVVGVAMLIIYFLINVNKTLISQGGDFTIQSLFAPMLRFLFGYALVGYGTKIINIILGINNSLIDWTQGKLKVNGSIGDYTDTLVEAITEDIAVPEAIIIILMLLVVFVLQVLACLVIMYHAVSRKLEIIARVGVAPIALGDAFNGEQSNAYRYLKKMMALIFSGVIMIAIVQVGTQLNISYMSDMFSGSAIETLSGFGASDIMAIAGIVLFPLAEAGMMSVAKQITNDAFGV